MQCQTTKRRIETGEVDPKKKKNKRKKKKKTASQDSHADEDEAGVDTQHSSRDYCLLQTTLWALMRGPRTRNG